MKLPVDGLGPVADSIRSISETIRTIRDSVALLPEVAETLVEIQAGVKAMGDEVHLMRTGVDAMGKDVVGMRSAVEPLEIRLEQVIGAIDRLEPRLDEMALTLHPLRRATTRLARRGKDDEIEPVLELAPEEGLGEGEPAENGARQTDSGENVSQADGSAPE